MVSVIIHSDFWAQENKRLGDYKGFPCGSGSKESACNDLGLIPGSGRSLGEGNGNPLQYSYLENSMDEGAWQSVPHGIAELDTTEWDTHTHVCHSFSSRQQVSLNFMAAVTVHSDFGAQENKVFLCFHFSPIYLPWSDGARCHDLSIWLQSSMYYMI